MREVFQCKYASFSPTKKLMWDPQFVLFSSEEIECFLDKNENQNILCLSLLVILTRIKLCHTVFQE